MPRYNVKVDKEKCIGCGACTAVCGDVFEIKDTKAFAKEPETDKECAKEGADACPVDAITVKEK
ncbi:ferredoxin [Candidatus Woesearchaeota archaeon]|nr:ferredoxin [Candidatus Woesearchaeota archaeon]